jgi:hypothetical protein
MPITEKGVVYMTREDWITKRGRLYNRLVQLSMARTYLEEQLQDYETMKRELESVRQKIRNTSAQINNLNRHLGD